MARPPRVQIIRRPRTDGTITFSMRVRANGADERIPLGNEKEGWDEVRVEAARKQLSKDRTWPMDSAAAVDHRAIR